MYNQRIRRIIELKEKLLEDKERAMDAAKRKNDNLTSNIEALTADIEKRHEALTKMHFSGGDFAVFRNYLVHLDAGRLACLKEQEELQARIEQMRIELNELLKEIRMLETLKTKAAAEGRKSENRRQQKMLDDIALRETTR